MSVMISLRREKTEGEEMNFFIKEEIILQFDLVHFNDKLLLVYLMGLTRQKKIR